MKLINGKAAITTESTLKCECGGMTIEVINFGQNGTLLKEQMLLLELQKKYPELLAVQDNIDRSLYLKEGLYQQAIQFLEERIRANGGAIRIADLNPGTSTEAKYIISVLWKLVPGSVVDQGPGPLLDSMDGCLESYVAKYKDNADPTLLDSRTIEIMKVGCSNYKKKVDQRELGGFYKYQEEHKKGQELLQVQCRGYLLVHLHMGP